MLATVETRLRDWQTQDGQTPFPVVSGAGTVAAVFEQGVVAEMELYVIPLPSSYQRATQDLGPICQQGVEQFGVAVGIKTYNDARGASGSSRIDSVKNELRRALVGWQPEGATDRVELAGSEPLGMKKETFWFICRFRYGAWLTQET